MQMEKNRDNENLGNTLDQAMYCCDRLNISY